MCSNEKNKKLLSLVLLWYWLGIKMDQVLNLAVSMISSSRKTIYQVPKPRATQRTNAKAWVSQPDQQYTQSLIIIGPLS